MHVGPAEFRSIRRGELLLRFAILGEVAYVVGEVPPAAAARVLVEEGCERPHWGFVVSGSVELDAAEGPVTVSAGKAFHIPRGVSHRISAAGGTRVAGFEPIDVRQDVSDAGLRAQGFELETQTTRAAVRSIAPLPGTASPPPDVGEVITSGSRMGDLLFSQARFGARSGYASPFCDLEHWGQVTAGNIAIEWEDDIEILTAGDVFYCPPGPPGHRFQAADPSATIDFTPLEGFARGARTVEWRRELATRVRAGKDARREVKVAPLR
jgi:quercetin dioxygenase-like cupin family protein